MLGGILSDPEISTEIKAKISYNAIMNIAESLFESPKSENIFRYKQSIFDTMDFILKDNNALKNLIGLTTFDFSLRNHSINVGIFGIGLAKVLLSNDSEHDLNEIAAGFFLHDIGKCSVPIDILNKKGPLAKSEWKIIKKHTIEGCEILQKHGALTKEAEIIVSQHHERHNGEGYPKGLKGNQVHMYAKICAIADVFDGLTSYRPYRKEYSSFKALKIMKSEMHKDFDPDFFAKFVKLFSRQ